MQEIVGAAAPVLQEVPEAPGSAELGSTPPESSAASQEGSERPWWRRILGS
jgi:hypothetical protein